MKTTLRILSNFLLSKWLSCLYLVFLLIFVVLFLTCKHFNGVPIKENLELKRLSRNVDQDSIKTFLFVAIITSPKGFLRRRAIRETWLKLDIQKVSHKFIVGIKGLNEALVKDLSIEQKKYGDLLFLKDYEDAYKTLTTKLLKTLLWINENVSSDFVMKADDDTFVRLNVLLGDLEKYRDVKRIYWGYFRGNSHVKKVGPWAEKKWYLSDYYLPYALGGGYLITSDLLQYIAKSSEYLQHYNSEDVSLGVWLAPVKLNYIHDVRFDTEYKSRGCSNRHIVSHKQEPEHMYEKYDQLIHYKRLCKIEVETMQTFDYKWNMPPSKCCKRVPFKSLKNF